MFHSANGFDNQQNIDPTTNRGQVPRLYFTARGVPSDTEKAGTGAEYDDVLGTGILVEQGGGVVTDGVDGGKDRQHAGRPVLMSRAMRDFAGLDQVTSCLSSHQIAWFGRGQREVSHRKTDASTHKPSTLCECKRSDR